MRELITLLIILLALAATVSAFEIDSEGYVTNVVDGDTIDVYSTSGFMQGEEFRIRFADINTPELSTYEGQISKSALASLINGKYVLIDVDDVTTYDPYGRVVAVVYLPVNETHALNVNYYMVVNGYAEIWDFTNNEFNPYEWRLYETLPAAQRVVNLNTSKTFSTIQAAIYDSETEDGHVIVVYPGNYEENVHVNKSVKIKSLSGNPDDVTVRIANETMPVFNVTANNVSIIGLSIEGSYFLYDSAIKIHGDFCRISGNSISNYRGGISVYNSQGCIISENEISNSYSSGIYLQHSNNTIVTNNTIHVYDSTGILIVRSSNNTIFGNEISGYDGTGVSLYYSRNTNVIKNRMDVTGYSSGIYLSYSSNNTILTNEISAGNGIGIWYSNSNNISLNIVSAKYEGLEASYSSRNKIIKNTIYGSEHGIYFYYGCENNEIHSNRMHQNTYDICISSSNNIISENEMDSGIYIPLHTYRNTIVNNTVREKPLFYCQDDSNIVVEGVGQAILINCSDVIIKAQKYPAQQLGFSF